MITFELNEYSKKTLYQELYENIKRDIISGELKAGEKLPSKRALAAHLKISINTIENAYSQLVAEGYIEARGGSGFYVESLEVAEEKTGGGLNDAVEQRQEAVLDDTVSNDILYDFRTNKVDTKDFPFSIWAKLSREILSEKKNDLLNSGDTQGIYELRYSIARYLKSFRGVEVEPEQIVVGAGSEYLLGLIVQLLGRDKAYGVENPGYKKIYQVFSANSSRVFPIPMDEKGAGVEAVSNFGLDVLHITPSHHFPLGIVMPVSRRQELLRWADVRDDRYIIEDDYDSEFRYEGRPIPPLLSMDKKGRVIYIHSFTKSLAPSMRISYMVLPKELVRTFRSRLGFYSCTVPAFEQYTLARFMSEGYFERHINRMKKLYRQRRDILIDCLTDGLLKDTVELSECDAGMHILLRYKNEKKGYELVSTAAKQGVRVYGLWEYYCFPEAKMSNDMIVMGFSGLNTDEIREGIRRLEQAWIQP